MNKKKRPPKLPPTQEDDLAPPMHEMPPSLVADGAKNVYTKKEIEAYIASLVANQKGLPEGARTDFMVPDSVLFGGVLYVRADLALRGATFSLTSGNATMPKKKRATVRNVLSADEGGGGGGRGAKMKWTPEKLLQLLNLWFDYPHGKKSNHPIIAKKLSAELGFDITYEAAQLTVNKLIRNYDEMFLRLLPLVQQDGKRLPREDRRWAEKDDGAIIIYLTNKSRYSIGGLLERKQQGATNESRYNRLLTLDEFARYILGRSIDSVKNRMKTSHLQLLRGASSKGREKEKESTLGL